jgi:thiamine-monophosphate kinase
MVLKILMRERQLMLDAFQENPDIDKSQYKPDFTDFQKAIEKHLLPKARLDMVEFFHKHHITPTSMIDVSDGLGSELKHLCRASQVGALIEETKLPILSETREICDEFEDDGATYALYGGEDYELLFTLNPNDWDKVSHFKDITIIGTILDEVSGIKMTDLFGAEVDLMRHSGFQHFTPEPTFHDPANETSDDDEPESNG